MVGKISVGGQGVDVRENRGRDGYRRWERKSSIRVGSGRNRGNYAIFGNRKRAKMEEVKKKGPGAGDVRYGRREVWIDANVFLL